MKQYEQNDLEADRQVATALAELIIGGTLLLWTSPQGRAPVARAVMREASPPVPH